VERKVILVGAEGAKAPHPVIGLAVSYHQRNCD
jgi:hypothetical protein